MTEEKFIPFSKDLIQEFEGNMEIPEIRVWCHPHKIGKSGDDYTQIFETFEDAIKFIKSHKEAEKVPLIAFAGYEINIFALK